MNGSEFKKVDIAGIACEVTPAWLFRPEDYAAFENPVILEEELYPVIGGEKLTEEVARNGQISGVLWRVPTDPAAKNNAIKTEQRPKTIRLSLPSRNQMGCPSIV